jgi:Mn2+/Fe2+ NRAMP family transporter
MNRPSGLGLLVLGIVLGIVGAIQWLAVTVSTNGFNINEAGVIMLVVGIAVAIVGLVLLIAGRRSRSTTKESVQETPTGQVRTQERFDSSSDL